MEYLSAYISARLNFGLPHLGIYTLQHVLSIFKTQVLWLLQSLKTGGIYITLRRAKQAAMPQDFLDYRILLDKGSANKGSFPICTCNSHHGKQVIATCRKVDIVDIWTFGGSR